MGITLKIAISWMNKALGDSTDDIYEYNLRIETFYGKLVGLLMLLAASESHVKHWTGLLLQKAVVDFLHA
jgi:hypothetical protein